MTKHGKAIRKEYGGAEGCLLCDFVANDGKNTRRVFMADLHGYEPPHGHVNLGLYYQTHLAMTISFKTRVDALAYLHSEGAIDNRLNLN